MEYCFKNLNLKKCCLLVCFEARADFLSILTLFQGTFKQFIEILLSTSI